MSDSEEEERPRIKVTDRRMFDRDGNVREDAATEEPASAVPDEQVPEVGGDEAAADGNAPQRPRPVPEPPADEAAASPRPRETDPATPMGGPAATGPRPVDGDASANPERIPEDRLQAAMDADREDQEQSNIQSGAQQSASELPRNFASFVESQYYETLLFLGAMRHPATGETVEDLDMARYKIDLLSMLQEKTEGNRTPEESQLLDDVLYQLRMGYLQKRKVGRL